MVTYLLAKSLAHLLNKDFDEHPKNPLEFEETTKTNLTFRDFNMPETNQSQAHRRRYVS